MEALPAKKRAISAKKDQILADDADSGDDFSVEEVDENDDDIYENKDGKKLTIKEKQAAILYEEITSDDKDYIEDFDDEWENDGSAAELSVPSQIEIETSEVDPADVQHLHV